MVHSIAARRAKTRRGRAAILHREAKEVENPKVLAVIRGHQTSAVVNTALMELNILQKPLSKSFSRKNDFRPFESGGEVALETLLSREDCSLFALGNHTKKRPHNLILGRLFDGHVLDLMEFGISDYKKMADFPGPKPTVGCKPCLVFKGDFIANPEHAKLKSLFLDLFRGDSAQEVDLAGLERLISVEIVSEKLLRLKNHMIVLKKSKTGSKLPRVELREVGPSMSLTLRRTQLASEDLMRAALRKPRGTKPKKVKNVSYDEEGLGDKVGRVFVESQNLDQLALRKMKGLKKRRQERDVDATDDDNQSAGLDNDE